MNKPQQLEKKRKMKSFTQQQYHQKEDCIFTSSEKYKNISIQQYALDVLLSYSTKISTGVSLTKNSLDWMSGECSNNGCRQSIVL